MNPRRIEFGVYLPQLRLDFRTLRERVQCAEALGYDTAWFYDHLHPPGTPDVPGFEGWTLVSALAPLTERIRLGQLVLCNGFRHPALLAQMAITLDVISGGRLELGLGTGSYPLGVKSLMEWEAIHGTLAPGERLLFHSDGLTEARNANEQEFGDSYVDAIVGWSPSASPAALVDTIIAEWKLFTGERAPEDDVSLAVIAKS